MKTILLGLVALALLGKLQDETIGSVTMPAKTVYNRSQQTNSEKLLSNHHRKDITIQPVSNVYNQPWSLQAAQKSDFILKDLGANEKIEAIQDWKISQGEYLAVFSGKGSMAKLRIYQKPNALSQYFLLHTFEPQLNCASNEVHFYSHTSDENQDGQMENWLTIYCKASPKVKEVFILDKDKTYYYNTGANEHIANLPSYLQAHAAKILSY